MTTAHTGAHKQIFITVFQHYKSLTVLSGILFVLSVLVLNGTSKRNIELDFEERITDESLLKKYNFRVCRSENLFSEPGTTRYNIILIYTRTHTNSVNFNSIFICTLVW